MVVFLVGYIIMKLWTRH